jgi:hypothetical protein
MASQLLMPQERPQAPLGIGAVVTQTPGASPLELHGESFRVETMR